MLSMLSFTGRSHRTEMAAGTIALAVFGLALLQAFALYHDWAALVGPGVNGPRLATLLLLAVPAFSLASRRLHDLDWPSWPLLAVAVPLITSQLIGLLPYDLADFQKTLTGIAVITGCPLCLVLFALPSLPSDNRFGPVPADWGIEAQVLAYMESRSQAAPALPRPPVERPNRAAVMAELVEPLKLPDGLDARALAIHARATRRHSAAVTPHNSLARI